MIHYDIGRAYSEMESADRRMARVETAVHILADEQGEKTRTMVDEALTISQNAAASSAELLGNIKGYLDSGDKVRAAEVAYNAHVLLMAAKENRSPVPPGYFASTVALLNNLPAVSDADVASRLAIGARGAGGISFRVAAWPGDASKRSGVQGSLGRIRCDGGDERRRGVSRQQPAHAAAQNGLAGAGRRGGRIGNSFGHRFAANVERISIEEQRFDSAG